VKVLLIEDDTNIADFMRTAFQVGWPEVKVEAVNDGATGLVALEKGNQDIVLLDVGLPDINGFDVLKRIRLFSSVPVVIITVSGDESYVVRGLALGADDYVVKPLRPLEMIARMKSLLRRKLVSADLDVACSNLHFGESIRELVKGEKKIALTHIESRLLYTLMKSPGSVVTYSQLTSELWGLSNESYQDSLKVHVRHLRQKIEDNPNHPKLILNKPGAGYLMAKSK